MSRLRPFVTGALGLMLVPFVVWAVVRAGGWERGWLVQLFAFTPYVAAAAWVVVGLTWLARRRKLALTATAVAVVLAAQVLPRAIPSRDAGPDSGVELRLLSSNTLNGAADAETLVRLVRDYDIDAVAFQEFNYELHDSLQGAGLGKLMPNAVLAPGGHSPAALYSRLPMTDAGSRLNAGGFMQAYATLTPPGAQSVVVESVHPRSPQSLEVLDDWRRDLLAQPHTDPDGLPRILIGDFNATLDHAPLRELISAGGYRDAADVTGEGLIGTWRGSAHLRLPPVTIDHALVDPRVGVRDYEVVVVPGTDHRALMVTLVVPQ